MDTQTPATAQDNTALLLAGLAGLGFLVFKTVNKGAATAPATAPATPPPALPPVAATPPACGPGFTYDPGSHSCISTLHQTATTCPPNYTFDPSSGGCALTLAPPSVCPQGSFSPETASNCNCPAGSTLTASGGSYTCTTPTPVPPTATTCPTGTFNQATAQSCVCTNGTVLTASGANFTCAAPVATSQTCPSGVPFSSSSTCTCPGGQTLISPGQGQYVCCPAGDAYSLATSSCTAPVYTPQTCPSGVPFAPSSCTCPGGQILISTGQGQNVCCPAGDAYSLVTNSCTAPVYTPQVQVTACPTGYFSGQFANCTCPAGTTLGTAPAPYTGYYTCQSPTTTQQQQCPAGTTYSSTQGCVSQCPSGYTYNITTGGCTPPSCPSGYTWQNGQCTATNPCPSGYTYNTATGGCTPPSCPSGYTWQNGQCTPASTCPAGYNPFQAPNGAITCCPFGYQWTATLGCFNQSQPQQQPKVGQQSNYCGPGFNATPVGGYQMQGGGAFPPVWYYCCPTGHYYSPYAYGCV